MDGATRPYTGIRAGERAASGRHPEKAKRVRTPPRATPHLRVAANGRPSANTATFRGHCSYWRQMSRVRALAAVCVLFGASAASPAGAAEPTLVWGGDTTLGSYYGLPPERGW